MCSELPTYRCQTVVTNYTTNLVFITARPQVPVTAQLIGHDDITDAPLSTIEHVVPTVPQFLLESLPAPFENPPIELFLDGFPQSVGHNRHGEQRAQPQTTAVRAVKIRRGADSFEGNFQLRRASLPGSPHDPHVESLVGTAAVLYETIVVDVKSQGLVYHGLADAVHVADVSVSIDVSIVFHQGVVAKDLQHEFGVEVSPLAHVVYGVAVHQKERLLV